MSSAATDECFRHVWNATATEDATQRQRLVVLSALTDTIREQKLALTPTAYYGAIMSSLEAQCQGGEADLTVGAVVYLLSALLPTVPPAILRERCADAVAVLLACRANYSDSAIVGRYVITSLAAVLGAQPAALWTQISKRVKAAKQQQKRDAAGMATQAWVGLLESIADRRPKVRKSAHVAVQTLVASGVSPVCGHMCTEFCTNTIRKSVSAASRRNGGHKDAAAELSGVLNFLKASIGVVAPEHMAQVLGPVLQACKLSDAHASMSAIQVLQQIADGGVAESMSGDDMARLVHSLLEVPVASLEAGCLCDFSTMLGTMLAKVGAANFRVVTEYIPAVWSRLQEQTQSDGDPAVVKASTATLKMLIEQCLSAEACPAETMNGILGSAAELFKYRYKGHWKETMPVVALLMSQLGPHCADTAAELVRSAAALCGAENVAGVEEAELRALRSVLGASVAAMGPTWFTSLVALDPALVESGNDGWVLNILRAHIHRAELGFFLQVVVPLDQEVQGHIASASPTDRFRLMQTSQNLWGLLVPLCSTRPTDVQETFGLMAKGLGENLQARRQLRTTICAAISALVRNSQQDSQQDGAVGEEGQGNLAAVGQFAKNFLPILFNMFAESNGGGESDVIANAISAVAGVADPQTLSTFFKTIMKKLLKAISDGSESDGKDRHVMTDLALALARALDKDNLQLLYRCVRPQLNHPDATLQKKSYKVVLFCLGASDSGEAGGDSALAGDREVLVDICGALSEGVQSCQAGARPLRHRCLQIVIQRIQNDELGSFAELFLGESILATKEPNVKARDAGNAVIAAIAGRMIAIDAFPQFLALLAGGLAGKSSHMMIASIGCMAKIVLEHQEASLALDQAFAEQLVGNVIMLLQHESLSVVNAALGFLKVATVAIDTTVLGTHLSNMVPGLLKWIRASNETRLKVRHLFNRLMRKLGEETVFEATPETHHKLLQNICKVAANTRKLKNKDPKRKGEAGEDRNGDSMAVGSDDDDDGSDSDDELEKFAAQTSDLSDRGGAKGASRAGGGGAKSWLQESRANEPLDLLDERAATHVSFNDPKLRSRAEKASKRLHASFKTSADGRLVIPEEESAGKNKRGRGDDDDGDDDAAMQLAAETEDASTEREEQERGNGKRTKQEDGEYRSGAVYKSSKAKGDVKRGNVDPFAYLPLDRRQLHKKTNQRRPVTQRYDRMATAAQKGAKDGASSKSSKHRQQRR